jgi:hypothetical protein
VVVGESILIISRESSGWGWRCAAPASSRQVAAAPVVEVCQGDEAAQCLHALVGHVAADTEAEGGESGEAAHVYV